jgi:putative sigma-54 modulation protein
MQITITGHHVEVSPALRAYVTEKMQRLSRHFDHVISVNVILNVEKLEQIAEASVNAGGRSLFATEKASDMYAAIDGLTDKIDRQVRRLKDRLREHNRARPEPLASNN